MFWPAAHGCRPGVTATNSGMKCGRFKEVRCSCLPAQKVLGQRKEVWAAVRGAITSPKFNQLFSFLKLLVVVLEPFSVDELFSVECKPSAPLRSALGFR